MPMETDQVYLFVDNWHLALIDAINDEDEKAELKLLPAELKDILRDRPLLRSLATSPLLCSMICAIHREYRKNLPNERNTLFKECVRILLSRDVARGIEYGADYPELSESQKVALLQGFAYWMMRNDKLEVDLEEADQRFSDRLPTLKLDKPTTGKLVRKYFVERTGLLREENARLRFTHHTFRVYLAAQQAIDEGDIELLKKNALNDQWRDMIPLSAGLANQRDRIRLLNGLVTRSGKLRRKQARRHMSELLLSCLENCVVLPPEIRQHVKSRIDELLS
jgi:predicted NACHT family NTPase